MTAADGGRRPSDDTLKVTQHIDGMFEAVTGRSPADIAAYGEQLKAAISEYDSPKKSVDFDLVFRHIDTLVARFSSEAAASEPEPAPPESVPPGPAAPQQPETASPPAVLPGPAPAKPEPPVTGQPAVAETPAAEPPPVEAPTDEAPAQAHQPVQQPRQRAAPGPASRPKPPLRRGKAPRRSRPAGPSAGDTEMVGHDDMPSPERVLRRRRSPWRAVIAAVVVLVIAGAAAAGFYVVSNRTDQGSGLASSPAIAPAANLPDATAGAAAIPVAATATYRARQTFVRDFTTALARYQEATGLYPSSDDAFVDVKVTFRTMAEKNISFPVPRAVLEDTIRYVSNGRSYKFILFGTGDCYVARRLDADTVDPARSFGDVDCYAYGAWTPGFSDR